jgi:LysM repeat protein
VIYQLATALQHKAHDSTSTTGKIFAHIYHAIHHKMHSLGIWWISKIVASIASIFLFALIVMSVSNNNITVFADNTLDIKDADDWYISLDWVILDDGQDFWARFAYIVKPWDTLDTIAREFGVTVTSLKSSNGITSTIINPWQELIISNVDGFIFNIVEQSSIRDFAAKYRLDLQDIKELNSIQNDNDILQSGDEIFVPLTMDEWKKLWLIVPEPTPQPEVIISPTITKSTKKTIKTPTTTKSTKKTAKSSGWVRRVSQRRGETFGFVVWQCTSYAAQKRPDIFIPGKPSPWRGNAKNRYANASAAWYSVGTKASVWAIAVMSQWWWW